MRKFLLTAMVILAVVAGHDLARAHHAGNRPDGVGNINEEMVHGINYDEGDEVGGWGMGAPDEAGMPPLDDFGYPGEGEMNQNYTDNGNMDESVFYPKQTFCLVVLNEWQHMIVNEGELDHFEYNYTYMPEPLSALLLAIGGACLIRKR